MDALVGANNGTLALLSHSWQGRDGGAPMAVTSIFLWFRAVNESCVIAQARAVDAIFWAKSKSKNDRAAMAEKLDLAAVVERRHNHVNPTGPRLRRRYSQFSTSLFGQLVPRATVLRAPCRPVNRMAVK